MKSAALNHPTGMTAVAEKPGRKPRKLLDLQSILALEDGVPVHAAVRDLSHDGCKIEAPLGLMQGLKLTITIATLMPLEAEVRWCKGGFAGLRFGGSALSSTKQPRSQERQPIEARAILRRAGKLNFEVGIFDLTAKGCKIEFIERPSIGERLWVKFDWLQSIEASVRWVDGFQGGLEFNDSVHPAVFEVLLAKLRSLAT